MDNLCHTLTGLLLARTRLGNASPISLPILLVAANLPDIDLLWSVSDDLYLLHHRGITHSFAGIAVQAGALAALGAYLERRRAAHRGDPAPPRAAWRLSILCAAGLASHLALDWLNVYGVRPWLPFDGRWHYGDIAFIVDPWLWLLLAAGGFLAAARTRANTIGLGIFGALGASAVLGHDRAPSSARPLWIAGLALIAIAYAMGWGARRPRAALAASGVLLAAYLGALAFLGRVAERAAGPTVAEARERGEAVLSLTRLPSVAQPLEWSLVVETRESIYWREVQIGGADGTTERAARQLDDARVQAALARVPGFRTFARLPFAQLEPRQEGTLVRLHDARYARTWSRRSWCSAEVRVGLEDGALE